MLRALLGEAGRLNSLVGLLRAARRRSAKFQLDFTGWLSCDSPVADESEEALFIQTVEAKYIQSRSSRENGHFEAKDG